MTIHTLYELVQHSVKSFASKVAFAMYGGEELSYAEVGTRVKHVQDLLIGAGLKAGDRILAIDTVDVTDKSSDEVSALLKGVPNTKMVLKIQSPYDKKPREVELVRKQILENQIASANAVNRADEKVQQAYKNSRDGIVVLPCYLPWKNGLYKTDALFVVYPSQRGGWSAQCVTDHKTKRPKLPFPQSWAGQPQEVIEQKSGIPGISFCHASRFLITAKDKETALAACRQVLKNNGRI